MAPPAPKAYMRPSTRPAWADGAASRAILVSSGETTPAQSEGRKKASSVTAPMVEIGSQPSGNTHPAAQRRAGRASRLVAPAPRKARPARKAGARWLHRPPSQCPTDSPARTTEMMAVQV